MLRVELNHVILSLFANSEIVENSLDKCYFRISRNTKVNIMRRAVNKQPVLKAQDFYLLLALLARRGEVMTYPELAAFSGLSMSEVHGALKRAEQARLLAFVDKQPSIIVPAFRDFLL